MPILINAFALGKGPEIELPISELEAWGTGGFSMACWLYRSGDFIAAGNTTSIVGGTNGAGNSAGGLFGLGANSNSGGAANSRVSIDRFTTGTSLHYLGTGNSVNGNNGNIWFNQWVGACISCDADSTVMPSALYYNWEASRYDWCLGFRGSTPSGTFTAPAPSLWLARSTYWSAPGALAFVQLWNRALTPAEQYAALQTPGSVRNGLTLYLPLHHDLRDDGPLKRHGRFRMFGDPNGNFRQGVRFPALGDGSGFGHIPRCPVRGVSGQPVRIVSASLESPTVAGGGSPSPVSGSGASALALANSGSGTYTPLAISGAGASTVAVTDTGTGALAFSGVGGSTLTVTDQGAASLAGAISASGSSTLALTDGGSGTYTPLAISGAGASSLAGLTDGGTGTHTLPGITGNGGSVLALADSGTATYTPQAITAAGGSTLAVTDGGAATYTPVPVTGAGGSTISLADSGAAFYQAGGIIASGGSTLAVGDAGAATYTPLAISANGGTRLQLAAQGAATYTPVAIGAAGSSMLVGLTASGTGATYVAFVQVRGPTQVALATSGRTIATTATTTRPQLDGTRTRVVLPSS